MGDRVVGSVGSSGRAIRCRCQRSSVSGVTSPAGASRAGECVAIGGEQGPVTVVELRAIALSAQHDDLEVFDRPERTGRHASVAKKRYKMRYTTLMDRSTSCLLSTHDRISGTHTVPARCRRS